MKTALTQWVGGQSNAELGCNVGCEHRADDGDSSEHGFANLVVDDQESVRSHLSQELLRMGVKQVLEAASAEEALAGLNSTNRPGAAGHPDAGQEWILDRRAHRDLEDGRWTPHHL